MPVPSLPTSTLRGTAAQTGKRIEQYAPELDLVVSRSEPIQELASDTGGALGPTEGPVWWKEGGYLLYSDIHNNRRMKYTPGQATSVFAEPTNRANGLTRDPQGRLLACEHGSRRVTRQEADGNITVAANSFHGRRLNRPNDVIVKSDGSIYFTDPWSSPLAREQWHLTYECRHLMAGLADDYERTAHIVEAMASIRSALTSVMASVNGLLAQQ
jgi:hypothetical protein